MEKIRGASIYSSAVEGITQLLAQTDRRPTLSDVAACTDIPEAQLGALFPTMDHLLIAMAENAMLILHHTLAECVARVTDDDPVEQFIAIANAYLEWGHRYPREFRIIGAMPASAFEGSERLVRYETSIHELMTRLLQRAAALGRIPADVDAATFVSIAHTFAYGIVSKMLLGDLARWNPGATDAEAARHTLRVFILQVLRQPR